MPVTEKRNESFDSIVVDMNNKRFFGCKFANCQLRYAGGQLEWDKHTVFTKCNWEFQDAAKRTINVLNAAVSNPFSCSDRSFSTQG